MGINGLTCDVSHHFEYGMVREAYHQHLQSWLLVNQFRIGGVFTIRNGVEYGNWCIWATAGKSGGIYMKSIGIQNMISNGRLLSGNYLHLVWLLSAIGIYSCLVLHSLNQ